MEYSEAASTPRLGILSLSGGELILAVIRIYTGSFGKKPDLALVNLLLFLVEGDGGIESDLLFSNTLFGPKSGYLRDFVNRNTELVKSRAYGKVKSSKVDPDTRKKLELTAAGISIADLAINSLSKREVKTISSILSKWGTEKHSEILTYICVFYEDFCTSVERKLEDQQPLKSHSSR